MKHLQRISLVVLVALAIIAIEPARAQVSYTLAGATYMQNFNRLSAQETNKNPPFAWTNNVTIPGWYAFHMGSTNPVTSYRGDDGTDLTGALYSYGVSGVAERALGSIASNTFGDVNYQIQIRNNSGKTLHSLTITYTGEQWRAGGPNTFEKLACSYKVGTSAWVYVATLDFIGPQTGGPLALNGNLAANRRRLTTTIVGLNWLPGQDVRVSWEDVNDAYNDHGLAIDDFSFKAI